MQELRPGQESEEGFVRAVDEVQRPQGYRLVAVFEEGDGRAAAVAGFRTGHSLAWGPHLYVDDLSTLPGARRRGHAGRLLDWLIDEARRLGCEQLHLDSGFGSDREDAHRLYANKGMRIASLHFARRLSMARPQGHADSESTI
jgi:GNAT superfamily N-acetyltransferase